MHKIKRYLSVTLLIVFFSIAVQAQKTDSTKLKPRPEDTIEQYFFVLIKAGSNKNLDSTQKVKLLQAHMANIYKLYYDGILKVSGPIGKNDLAWQGIFIFDCKTKAEAEKIVQSDPAIAAGLFTVDIAPLYSAPIGSFKHGKPEKPNDVN